MDIKLRYFTVPEAESLIPELAKIFDAALETKKQIEAKIESWRKDHDSMKEADEAVIRSQVDFLAGRLETQLGEISELGCIPKDLEMGLVDFPARIEGQEGYLCWKRGEKKITHWHGITEGFPGRKPLKKENV